MRWKAGNSGVFLWPNPFFLPKTLSVAALNQVIELHAFGQDGSPDALLCPVRALRAYVERTRTLRRGTSQLFVCFGQGRLGLAVSKQRLAHWLVETTAAAYGSRHFPVLEGLVGHSTRCVATSWAAFSGSLRPRNRSRPPTVFNVMFANGQCAPPGVSAVAFNFLKPG